MSKKPTWHETASLHPQQRGFVRLELDGLEIKRVDALIVDREEIAYYSERRPGSGQIVLTARTPTEVLILTCLVDDETARLVDRLDAWRLDLRGARAIA